MGRGFEEHALGRRRPASTKMTGGDLEDDMSSLSGSRRQGLGLILPTGRPGLGRLAALGAT